MDAPAIAEPQIQAGTPHTRYTSCGEPAAEARVAQDLSRLSTGIDSELGEEMRGLILTGPFARAEGGIVYSGGEPHADAPGYELLAVFRTRHDRHVEQLEAMAATWGRLLRTRVAICAFSAQELEQVAATRFWFHAGRGWLITLLGDPALCLAIPRREPAELRWQEAAFALCEGLVPLALSGLTAGEQHAGTLDRMQRAVLACGDALLLRRGSYADTLAARADALDKLHASAVLRAAYRDAIRYCARPDAWQPESGDRQNWLQTTRRVLADAVVNAEAERLGSARTLAGFLDHEGPLFCEPGRAPPAVLSRVLRALPLPSLRDEHAHPVERLLRASVALALAPRSPECRTRAAEQLALPASLATDAALASALRALAADALPSSRLEQPFAFDSHEPPTWTRG
jgi:hypothetical protein